MANQSPSLLKTPGVVLVLSYFILFTVNSLVLYLANLWFPQYVVLGTMSLTKTWAIIHSMGTLAIINTFSIPFINHYEKVRGKMFAPKDWMLIYFAINLIGVWLVARFSEQFGLGITSWIVAIVMALVLDAAQGAAMMQLEKYRAK